MMKLNEIRELSTDELNEIYSMFENKDKVKIK